MARMKIIRTKIDSFEDALVFLTASAQQEDAR